LPEDKPVRPRDPAIPILTFRVVIKGFDAALPSQRLPVGSGSQSHWFGPCLLAASANHGATVCPVKSFLRKRSLMLPFFPSRPSETVGRTRVKAASRRDAVAFGQP
jgi:hypothetical protein